MKAEAEQNESALVCAARGGDKEALRLLLTRNWAWLKALVYGIIADANEVDDILQDICVRVISKINTLRDPQRFRPWLAILARRQALGHRQRKNRRPISLNETITDQQYDEKAGQLLENLEQTERCQQVIQVVKSLPEKYRQVLLLEYSEDLTYAQIAKILDVPITTVQTRLLRARRMVYKRITGNNKDKVQERWI
jgi:RNA polymerase sigma-70 factor (ECF subfamily)